MYLEENHIIPIADNVEDSPTFGQLYPTIGKYRLPSPAFDDIDQMADWCKSHPVDVAMTVFSCAIDEYDRLRIASSSLSSVSGERNVVTNNVKIKKR